MDNYKYNKYKYKYINYKNQSGGVVPATPNTLEYIIKLAPDTISMEKTNDYDLELYKENAYNFTVLIGNTNISMTYTFLPYIKLFISFIKMKSLNTELIRLANTLLNNITTYCKKYDDLNNLVLATKYWAYYEHMNDTNIAPLQINIDKISSYMSTYNEYKNSINDYVTLYKSHNKQIFELLKTLNINPVLFFTDNEQ